MLIEEIIVEVISGLGATYIVSYPLYVLLYKILQKFSQFDANFWKLFILAPIAFAAAFYFYLLAIGGDGTPPPSSVGLTYIFYGEIAFTTIFLLSAKLFGATLNYKSLAITFAFIFILLDIGYAISGV